MHRQQSFRSPSFYLAELFYSAGIWFFCIISLGLFRLCFLIYFQAKIPEGHATRELLLTLAEGMALDMQVATGVALIVLMSSYLLLSLNQDPSKLRIILGELFCATSAILFVLSINYFKEFNSHFHHILFQVDLFEFKSLGPILVQEYNIPLNLALMILLIYFLKFSLSKFDTFLKLRWAWFKTTRLPLAGVFLIYIMSLGASVYFHKPAPAPFTPPKSSISDEFLRKASANPFTALIGSARQHFMNGSPPTPSQASRLHEALSDLYPDTAPSNNLDDYLKKTAGGPSIARPGKIFLIFMESYGSWPMMPKYSSLHLTDNLKALARQGLWIKKFLSDGASSAESVNSLLTGLHYAHGGGRLSLEYPTAPAAIMRKLGYTTRFFYGGELSWHNLSSHLDSLGFDQAIGTEQFGASTNAWKVPDRTLFDLVSSKLDHDTASFNVIFTTSNHPPYNIDIYREGFPLTEIPHDISGLRNDENALKRLGHLWYSDKTLGEFVEKASTLYPDSLFVFAGDHSDRGSILHRPSFYENASVPFVLYSRNISLPQPSEASLFGSHMDILPTLVELIAPRGFSYHSPGQDMLKRSPTDYSVGFNALVSRNFLVNFNCNPAQFFNSTDVLIPTRQPIIESAKKTFDSTCIISRWRSRYGPNTMLSVHAEAEGTDSSDM